MPIAEDYLLDSMYCVVDAFENVSVGKQSGVLQRAIQTGQCCCTIDRTVIKRKRNLKPEHYS